MQRKTSLSHVRLAYWLAWAMIGALAFLIMKIEVPIIPGIMPVINAAQIKRMITICGASFPIRFQKIIQKFENNKPALFDAGMSYELSQIIDLLASDIEGIHLYTMNNPVVARKICEGIRNVI